MLMTLMLTIQRELRVGSSDVDDADVDDVDVDDVDDTDVDDVDVDDLAGVARRKQ